MNPVHCFCHHYTLSNLDSGIRVELITALTVIVGTKGAWRWPTRRVTPTANPFFEAEMALRTASQEAAFFLPSLRPGIRVLDLGCGPGSITLGLAEAVDPGEVVGVDLQPNKWSRRVPWALCAE